MNNLTSLCLLAYQRPNQLKKCLDSIETFTDLPYELIVNVDGGDSWSIGYISELVNHGEVSKAILVGGNNRGVGRSFQNCLGVAEGEYIAKLDTDLVFKPQWLSTAINILKNNPDIGAIGLFDYSKTDPNDTRFKPENNILEERTDCYIVKDFVSCSYLFRAIDLVKIEPVKDDGNHTKLGKLALVKESVVINESFGVHKSVYVSGTEEKPYKTMTYTEPLVFQKGRS